jgi:hypothetical protein
MKLKSQIDSKHGGLIREPLFLVSILLPLLLSLFLLFFIAVYNDLKMSFTLEGLNLFLDYMKIPLGIASLAFPFSAIVIANHKSNLSLEQMREIKSTNRMSNYYKHRDEFFILCDNCSQAWSLKFKVQDPDLLYSIVFPEVNLSNFEFEQVSGIRRDEYFKKLVESINSAYENIEEEWRKIDGINSCKPSKKEHNALRVTCSILDCLYCSLQMRVEEKYPLANELYGDLYFEYWIFIPEGNPYDAFQTINNFVLKLGGFSMVEQLNIKIVNLPEGSWDAISKLRNASFQRHTKQLTHMSVLPVDRRI